MGGALDGAAAAAGGASGGALTAALEAAEAPALAAAAAAANGGGGGGEAMDVDTAPLGSALQAALRGVVDHEPAAALKAAAGTLLARLA